MTRAMILLLDCSLTFANFQEKCKIDKILPLRSSDQRCSVRKGALRNFKKLTGKQLWQSLFLIKLQVFLQLYLKKRLRHRCFSVNFAKFLRIPFLQNVWVTASQQWIMLETLFFSHFNAGHNINENKTEKLFN